MAFHLNWRASLAFLQGFLLHVKAENDPELGWPGGAEAMWSEAARHYERAARLGHPAAAAAAAYALAARERELGE